MKGATDLSHLECGLKDMAVIAADTMMCAAGLVGTRVVNQVRSEIVEMQEAAGLPITGADYKVMLPIVSLLTVVQDLYEGLEEMLLASTFHEFFDDPLTEMLDLELCRAAIGCNHDVVVSFLPLLRRYRKVAGRDLRLSCGDWWIKML